MRQEDHNKFGINKGCVVSSGEIWGLTWHFLKCETNYNQSKEGGVENSPWGGKLHLSKVSKNIYQFITRRQNNLCQKKLLREAVKVILKRRLLPSKSKTKKCPRGRQLLFSYPSRMWVVCSMKRVHHSLHHRISRYNMKIGGLCECLKILTHSMYILFVKFTHRELWAYLCVL